MEPFFASDSAVAWVWGEGFLEAGLSDELQKAGVKVLKIDDSSPKGQALLIPKGQALLLPDSLPNYIFFLFTTEFGDASKRLSIEALFGKTKRVLEAARRTGAKFAFVFEEGAQTSSRNEKQQLIQALITRSCREKQMDGRIIRLVGDYSGDTLPSALRGIFAGTFGLRTRGKIISIKFPKSEKVSVAPSQPKQKQISSKRKSSKPILVLIGVGFILSPFISLLVAFGITMFSLNQMNSGNFELATKTSSVSTYVFSSTSRFFDFTSFLPVFGRFFEGLLKTSNIGYLGARSVYQASSIGITTKSVLRGILSEGYNTDEASLARFSQDVESLATTVGFLKAETEEFPLFRRGQFLDKLRFFSIASLIKELLEILGYSAPRTYLVLFQNNMELRPTGGFIGSFGLFTFDKGKLVSSEIQDVYTADGNLRGHIEPPAPIREYLGEANWFLRDSNWSPSFPASANRAEWFLGKELDIKVDGVIAVDLEFVKRLLSLLGKVHVTDFDETLTPANFYDKTQSYAQSGFFPGSTQKKDFVTALSRSIISEIILKAPNLIVPMGRVVFSSLNEKHILVALHNKNAKTEIEKLGWDGEIKNVQCPMPNVQCAGDYLMAVDSNFGANKANKFISRSFILDVYLRPKEMFHELTIVYKNNAVNSSDQYKNYLRIYAQDQSVFSKVLLVNPKDGRETPLDFAEFREKGKRGVGMLVPVPPRETRYITISWANPLSEKKNKLLFLWQKQPGTFADPVVLRFHTPKGTNLRLSPSPSLTGSGIAGYTTTLATDFETEVVWAVR